MSGWRIVPAVVTDERAATAVMVAHEAGYPMIAVSVAREVIKADIAAAPEPDWEALAVTALETLSADGFNFADRLLTVELLKAAFGSKPQQSEIVK